MSMERELAQLARHRERRGPMPRLRCTEEGLYLYCIRRAIQRTRHGVAMALSELRRPYFDPSGMPN